MNDVYFIKGEKTMKLIKLMVITTAVMLCTAQAFAYSFVNADIAAEIAADGRISVLKATGTSDDLVDTMYATIYYSLSSGGAVISKSIGGDFSNLWTNETPDLTPEAAGDMLQVASLYRIAPRGAGDTLDVKVSTKLEDDKTYLAQRYWVEYDENGGFDLFDVKLEITMVSSAVAPVLWAGMQASTGPIVSDWGSTSPWTDPTDTAHLNSWRVQGYVPGIPDDKNILPPKTITMNWALGDLGNVPVPAVVGALELRMDVVPEPCTMALMGAGLLGLFGARRKRS